MSHSKEVTALAADIVRVLDTNQVLTLDQIAERVGIGRGHATELATRLEMNNIFDERRIGSKKAFMFTGNMVNLTIEMQEYWVATAINGDI